MSQLRGTDLEIDYVAAKEHVISGLLSGTGISRTLTEAESGSTVMFDSAAGTTYTLPVAEPGINYNFVVLKPLTGASSKIITNVTTHTPIIIGHLLANITNSSPIVFNAINASLFAAIRLNAITAGGVDGGAFRLVALSRGTWFCSGLVTGTAALATPFSVIVT